MQETILRLLTEKFSGVSDAILGRMAKKLAETATTEDAAKTAVEATTFQQVLESYGDSRATDATKTAVLNYEKKHNLKDGKPVESPATTEDPKQQDDTPAWARQLAEQVKTLSEQVTTMRGNEITATRRQKLDAVLQPLTELQRKPYTRIPLADMKQEDFDTFLTEVTGEVAEMVKQSGAKGAVFGMPTVAGASVTQTQTQTQEPTNEEVDAVISHLNI